MFIKSPFTLVLLLATLGFCATSQASVGPEIAVQQPAGTDLVDGTASIDFGNQTLTTSSAAKTFTITNSGLLDLAVTNIVTDGANASDFAVDTTGMLNRLVSGASTTFTVTFTPGANGVRTAAIHINNNDSNEDPFDINLTGTSMDYSVTTTPNSIVVTAISTNSETLTVSEPSAGNINFAAAGRIFCVNGGTSFSGDSGTNSLAGISSITVNASADIVNLGTFVGTLPSLTMNGSSFNAGAIGLQTNSALTINVTNASAITGIVSGVNATLTKGGSGTLTLSGTNTYSGATTISQGILKMGNVSALGSVTVGTTVSDGATIDLNGISLATEPITLNGVGVGATGAVTNSAAATARINGTATLASDTIITVGNGTIEIPGKVTGPGGMIKQGNGFLTLSATNDYAGVTTLNAGIITIQRNGALGSSSGKTVVNSTARLNFQMALNDSYSIPEPVDLNNGGTMSATFNPEIFTGPITLTGTSTMSLGSGSLTITGPIGGTGGFSRSGTNTFTLTATNTYAGTTANTAGPLLVNGILSEGGTVTISSTATLGGTGTVNRAVTVNSGGFVAPGATNGTNSGILNTTNISFLSGATFKVDINGTNVGADYDQINVTGTVSLSNVTLSISGAYLPQADDGFVIINNDGNDPITGTFNGLPEGSMVTINGVQKQISYVGGTGNDVVLQLVPEIGVQQPVGTNLVDGNASISFGSVGVGSSSNLTFTITNSGTVNLILTNITTDGANASDFSVGVSGSTNLAPATSTSFTVTFTPASAGSRTAALHIANNDGNENPFDINLTGTGFLTEVQNTNDNGFGSLRQAISDVLPGTKITFATNLSGSSIVLTNGQLLLTKYLTIDASGLTGGLTIDGHTNGRIFQVNSGVTNVFSNLTLTGGNGSGATSSGNGGAIYNAGVLTLIDCTLNGNVVPSGKVGGALYSGGVGSSATLLRCVVSTNKTTGGSNGGGGIYADASTVLNCTNCSFISNTSSNTAGAVHVISSATATLVNCTFKGNSAFDGGTVRNTGATLTLLQCTLNANTASGDAAGLYLVGSTGTNTVRQCTIAGNSSPSGGAGVRFFSGVLTVENSIIAGNTGTTGPDMNQTGGTLTRVGNNIIGINTSVTNAFPVGSPNTNGDYVGTAAAPVNALLTALGTFGGSTQTMPLASGSPAINKCTNGTSFTTDQRGSPRVFGSAADIGAVEGVFDSGIPIATATLVGNSIQLGFTNLSGAGFTILGSTDIGLSLNSWSNLGPAVETPSATGQYQFNDLQATNNPQRFYRVRCP